MILLAGLPTLPSLKILLPQSLRNRLLGTLPLEAEEQRAGRRAVAMRHGVPVELGPAHCLGEEGYAESVRFELPSQQYGSYWDRVRNKHYGRGGLSPS